LKAQNLSGMADKFNDIKEQRYQSTIREPLGKSYQRGYNWVEEVQQPAFSFGVGTKADLSAKELLYPRGGALDEKQDIQAMYIKTHGNFAAGAQKTRHYDWPVNPESHVFGLGEVYVPGGVARAVHAEREAGAFPKTVIVKKTVEDSRAVTHDMLGQVKNLGQGKPMGVTQDRIFGGASNKEKNAWNAGMCIQGQPTMEQLQPDKDLGITLRPNCSNNVRK
jgi:hypothetical protein